MLDVSRKRDGAMCCYVIYGYCHISKYTIRSTYFNITFLFKLIMGLDMLSLGKMKMRFTVSIF